MTQLCGALLEAPEELGAELLPDELSDELGIDDEPSDDEEPLELMASEDDPPASQQPSPSASTSHLQLSP